MRIPLYQVDAFADRVFAGNPAAVCPLDAWLPDATMQAIAAENNLSETAFLVGAAGEYAIRWFTPRVEVDLCGHATLAAAHVVFQRREPALSVVRFASRSGPLLVTRADDLLRLDLPAHPASPCPPPPGLAEALGRPPCDVLAAGDLLLAVFATEDEIRALRPDFGRLERLDASGVAATAPGRGVDFVSRFFAPREGIPEDPVTGSAHCTLTPYWAHRLHKARLRARQLSARGGELHCEDRGERVWVAGGAVLYLEGMIDI